MYDSNLLIWQQLPNCPVVRSNAGKKSKILIIELFELKLKLKKSVSMTSGWHHWYCFLPQTSQFFIFAVLVFVNTFSLHSYLLYNKFEFVFTFKNIFDMMFPSFL
jgi:hypothetical protein